MSTQLSIIIPAYNEAARILPTLSSVNDFLGESGLSYEILVVDDGSSDDTIAVVERAAEDMPAIRCIESKPNRGKGHVVRVGMLAAAGEIRLMCDADGSMPASEIPKLINPIVMEGADIAIGSRYADGASVDAEQPLWRRVWSRIANRIVQRTLVPGIKDTQCGFKAFTAESAEQVFSRATIDGWAFDLEALALASRLGFEVKEIAVHWDDDERSRVSPLKDLFNIVSEWISIRMNLSRGRYGDLRPLRLAEASLSMRRF